MHRTYMAGKIKYKDMVPKRVREKEKKKSIVLKEDSLRRDKRQETRDK